MVDPVVFVKLEVHFTALASFKVWEVVAAGVLFSLGGADGVVDIAAIKVLSSGAAHTK